MTEEQLQLLHKIIIALLDDIESMQHSEMTNWFGPFSHYNGDNEGVTIEWPNLTINLENIHKILEEIDRENDNAPLA